MSVPLRLGAFAAMLAVVFVLALGIGSAVGPIDLAGEGEPSSHGNG